MKRILILIMLASLILIGGTATVRAATNTTKPVSIDKDTTYNGTFVRTGSTIKIEGKLNGDAFLAAQDIVIDGEVSGNVYAVAQNITIKGKIGSGLHLAAARIEVASEVSDNIIAAGSIVSLTKDAKLGGAAMIAGSTVDINGSVGNDIYAAGSTVTLAASVGGSATVVAEQVNLTKGASINGNLTYYSAQEASIENDTKIAGSIKRVDPSVSSRPSIAKRAVDTLYSIIAQLLIGLIVIAFLPKSAIASAEYINRHPLKSFLVGIGVFFGALLSFVIAVMAIFGLPLAIMIALVFILLIMLATIFLTPFWLGRLVIRTKDNKFGNLALSLLGGIVIVAILLLLPVIGSLFGFVMFFISLGALSMRNYERFHAISVAQRD